MVASREHRHAGEALGRLASALESLELGPRSAQLAGDRDRLAGVLRSYLIPRATDPEMPMTVVVAGPTGSGKSTLVNSLTGSDVSATSALRPTTREPVVVASPQQAGRYEVVGGVECRIVEWNAPALEHMVLIDAPDIDSTSTGHRAMAETLIDNADIVVFVTSAMRYADEVPWQVLRRANARGTPVIQVLNRVGSASAGAIVDFRSRLRSAGLDDELITVAEHHLGDSARVPPLAVRSLRRRLQSVVSERDAFAGEVFARVLRSTLRQVEDLRESLEMMNDEIDGLEAEVGLDLVGRSPGLDLADVAAGTYPHPPDRGGLARRRWKAKTAPHPRARETIETRLVSAVEADVRKWLVAERVGLRAHGLDHRRVIEGVRAVAVTAARGWMEFVARVAADHDERLVHLGGVVLLDAAVSDTTPAGAEVLFGDRCDELAERARRALEGRLEVVYEQIGALVAEESRLLRGNFDGSELRDALGAATATLAPVYA